MRFTKKYFQKYYFLEEEDIEETNKNFSETSKFNDRNTNDSFEDQQILDNAIDSLKKEELQNQIENLLKPILELINNNNTYEEIMEKLLETYPDMDQSDIEQLLTKAVFLSEIWGRLNAN